MIYHILNGDALLAQFPQEIPGRRYVARECLVDGPVAAESFSAFWQQRAAFISQAYGDTHLTDYQQDSFAEFERMQAIPAEAEIYLWFEDDLFCQVNCWFVIYWLTLTGKSYQFTYVRPSSALRYGFGGMDTTALVEAFQASLEIRTEDLSELRRLWPAYQQGNHQTLIALGQKLAPQFPFLLPAIEADIARHPANGDSSPHTLISRLVQELGTTELGPIFRAFQARAPIYGFGDLQVSRMLQEVR